MTLHTYIKTINILPTALHLHYSFEVSAVDIGVQGRQINVEKDANCVFEKSRGSAKMKTG